MAMMAIRNMAAPLLFSDTDAEDGQLQQQGHNLRCFCMSTIGTPNASPDMLGLNELARLLMFNLHYACQGCSKGMFALTGQGVCHQVGRVCESQDGMKYSMMMFVDKILEPQKSPTDVSEFSNSTPTHQSFGRAAGGEQMNLHTPLENMATFQSL